MNLAKPVAKPKMNCEVDSHDIFDAAVYTVHCILRYPKHPIKRSGTVVQPQQSRLMRYLMKKVRTPPYAYKGVRRGEAHEHERRMRGQ